MDFTGHSCGMSYNKCEMCSLEKIIDKRLHEAKRHGGGVRERVESGVFIVVVVYCSTKEPETQRWR